ncbi:MAG: type II toxin-antitoxin system HicA family toxin [Candidatus Hydrogenedentes bacterium]|nr:type II toxin-antitoxin system HicA family toxin [Candidatus Hydrogenedentota bacterium]
MTRRQKLFDQMRNNPGAIRFSQVEALLKYEGFVLFNQRGSHCTFHRADGRLLTLVKPHGGRRTCHPSDIRRLLELLRDDNDP